MERGDIDAVGLDPTRGHEQQGQRPVLVVSATALNRVTRVPVVVPITSGCAFARTAGFAVPLKGAGPRTTGVVRCNQPRGLDLAARAASSAFRTRCWGGWWPSSNDGTAGLALDRRDPAAQVRRSCRSSVKLMDRRVP